MEPTLTTEIELDLPSDEHVIVHEWRSQQLRGLGVRPVLADRFADHVDWRAVAVLVERGCPAELALEIVR
jgi:hypothetical protein